MNFLWLPSFLRKKTKNRGEEQPPTKETEFASPDSRCIDLIAVNQPPQKQINQNKNSSEIQQEANMSEVIAKAEKIEMESIVEYINSLENIKSLNRISYKNTSAIQENTAAIKEFNTNLQKTRQDIEQLKYSLDEMLIYQRQQNGTLKREIEEWEQATVDYFRLLERAIDCEADENKSLLQKILDEFAHIATVRGLERIIPEANQTLNEKLHEAIEIEESSEISPRNIIKCKRWGYRVGSHVIEKAKVVIANPLATN
ncbi:MAG: nucleotide exchange factor GrpE [Scytonematopsis contorta HA4267-MV1]|jgi:molecular chaperone GrpE (heat shock protein)|nr:nucleotide exchange factor GrpE [Scytonematopsis contorta HA4267-MV1]